jgi:hypothetical protein
LNVTAVPARHVGREGRGSMKDENRPPLQSTNRYLTSVHNAGNPSRQVIFFPSE